MKNPWSSRASRRSTPPMAEVGLGDRLVSTSRTELARRSSRGIEVTLLWERSEGADAAVVCVSDHDTGAYFEIPAEPYLALDVYYHPFAYRDFSTVDSRDRVPAS
jgi:hypothetical protein